MENGWYDSTPAAAAHRGSSSRGRSGSSSRSRVVGNELEFSSGAKITLPPVNKECYAPPSVASRGENRYFQVDQPTEYRVVNKYFEEKEDECGNVIEQSGNNFGGGQRDERLFIEKRHLSTVDVNSREAHELVQLPPVNRTCYKSRSQSRNISRPRRIESMSGGLNQCVERPVNTFEQSARLQGYNYANNNVSMIDISHEPFTEVKRFSRASYRDIKKPRNNFLPRQSIERPPASVSVGIVEQQQPAPFFTEVRHRSQSRDQSTRNIGHSKIGIEQIVHDIRAEQPSIREQAFVEQQSEPFFPSEPVQQNNDIYWDQNQNQFVQESAQTGWPQESAPQVPYRPPIAPRRESKRETAPFEYVEQQQPTFTQDYQAKIFRDAPPVRRSSRHRSPAPTTFVPQEPLIPVHSDSSQVNEGLRNILPPVNRNCFRPPSVQRGEDKFYEVNEPTEYNEVVEDVIVNDSQDFIVDQPQPQVQTNEVINYGTSVIDEPRASSFRTQQTTPFQTEQIITQVPNNRKIDIKTYFESFGNEENADQIIEESLKNVLPPVNCACARRPREEVVTGDVKYFNVQEPTEYKNVREDVFEEDKVIALDCNQSTNHIINQGFTTPKQTDCPPPQQQQQQFKYEYESSNRLPPADNSHLFQARHYINNQPVFEKMVNNSRNSGYYQTEHRENASPKSNVRSMANDFIQNLDYHDYDQQFKASGLQNLNKDRRAYGSHMNVNFSEPHRTIKPVSKDQSAPFNLPSSHSKNYEKLITQVIDDHQTSQRGGNQYQSMRNLHENSSVPLSYNQMKFQEFKNNGYANSSNTNNNNNGQGYLQTHNSTDIGRSVQHLPFTTSNGGSSNFFNAGPSREYQTRPSQRRVPSQYQPAPSHYSNNPPPSSLGRRVQYHQSQFDLSSNTNELQGPMHGFRSLRARRE